MSEAVFRPAKRPRSPAVSLVNSNAMIFGSSGSHADRKAVRIMNRAGIRDKNYPWNDERLTFYLDDSWNYGVFPAAGSPLVIIDADEFSACSFAEH